MDSKETEELRNDTATDDTIAWNKKRGRRVSFAAEMTSVHVFDRDEDLETPPEAKQDADRADEVVRFSKDLDDSDDFREPKEDDMFERQPFLQPFESPSPGSSFGSATSNGEDDFFGPVSSEFIRPGRLSDSVASDDNHEITMDSTAFSMHFRSLARSESGDLKTPTGSHLVFEEKTPTQSGTTTVQGSSMELTGYEKSVPNASIPVDKFGSGKDSSDMSLVEDNPRKYDYANISPRLDELMSDGNKLPHGVPTSESSDVIIATNYSRKKSNTFRIESGSKSSVDAQATDLESPSVHDSDTASGRVRGELLTKSQSPVDLLVSDSLQYHEQVTEQPSDDKNQSSSPRLDELMSDGNKLLHGVLNSESSDVIGATNYSGKKSSTTTTRIESASKSSEDAQATDSENPSVHDSDIASSGVREELLTNSQSPVHLLVSDSLQYHEQVAEQPNDDRNQSSSQHKSVSEINEDIDLNHVEAQMASIRSGKTSELSSPVPSLGLSTQIVPSHIHSRDALLKQSEATHTNDSSYQKFQSHSPAVSYPLTLVEQREDIHGEGRHEADTVHSIGMHTESPLVAITSSAYAMKAQLVLDAANSSGQLKITPKNLGGYMFDHVRTDTDVFNGVSSSSCTPAVGDSSIQSKLFSCIVKTPQHVMPVSRLEDQFLGTGQGQIVQKMTADVDNNEVRPSEKLGDSLLILPGTNADVRYSSKEKSIPRLKLDGVFSLSGTPVVGDSSMRSKLSSYIVKTPQHDMPASHLEDQFLGTEQGQIAQKITADVMPSENLGGSLLNQAVTDADVRSLSKAGSILRLKLDGVSSLGGTPVAGHSSIRSKLSSCIVKTPQPMPVSRLEDQFLGIYQGQCVQKMTSDVDDKVFTTPRDREDLPFDVVAKFKATGGRSSQLTADVKEEPRCLQTLQNFSGGTVSKSGNISSSLRITHRFLSDKKLGRTPDRMLFSQNRGVVSRSLPPHRDSSHNGLPGSPCGLNHDVVQSYHTESSSFKIMYGNTDSKSNNSIEKILPSQKSSVLRSPSTRDENTLHVELNRQTHSDRAIRMSHGEDGDSMDIMSGGNYLNVVAQKLDNLFMEQDFYSKSPLYLNDHEKSPLQAHPSLSGATNGLLHNAVVLQTPMMSGTTFSGDESQSMVLNAGKESLLGSSEKDTIHIKAPEFSVHKRRHSQVVTGSGHSTPNVDKPKSSKVQKKGVNESVKQNGRSDDDQSRCGTVVTLKHWSAILSDVLADSEQLHPTSVERLDHRKIESLEDVVIQLQKVHSVSRLCTSFQTKGVGNHHNLARNRRISKTKELLQKVLYEQAKLKLLRAKREKLLKTGEIIRSSIRDCQTMKLNCSQLHEYVKRNAKAGISDPQSLTAQFEEQQNVQVADNELLQMRQKVGAAQRDIDSLIYSFHACFKMKEKSTNVDTITLINDYFKRRSLFKSLREDVQLWEIDDVVYKKGQNQISLNYHGYLIQRFTLVAPISTVTVSYMLSHPNIEKKHPNMDARIAFSFVFKEGVEQKYVGIRSLAQETQVTSSILLNLLDVIEEVKLARLDVKHLKEARFLSPSAEKLHLCLHFVDFKTAMKVNVALDVSCLTRGIYPSDVLPAQLLPAGLQAAVENLKVGFSRIIRTCRCISEALASSN
ncbi:unnamed protein product [Rhodiola kirilowii]